MTLQSARIMTSWRDLAGKFFTVFLALCLQIDTARCLKCYICDTTSSGYEEANQQCNAHSLRDCPNPKAGACMIETYRAGGGRAQVVKQCLRQCPVYVNTTAQHIRCCMQDGCNDLIVTAPPPRNNNALPSLPSPGGAIGEDPGSRGPNQLPPNLRPPNQRPNNQRPNNQRPPNQRPPNLRSNNQRPNGQRPPDQRPPPNQGPPGDGPPREPPGGGGPRRDGPPPPPDGSPSPRPDSTDPARKRPDMDGKHGKGRGKVFGKNGAGAGGTKRKQNQGKKGKGEGNNAAGVRVGGTGGATLCVLAVVAGGLGGRVRFE